MCIIETKTYHHANGRQVAIETHSRCHNAPSRGGLCSNVDRRDIGSSGIVERRPSNRPSAPEDSVILVTESSNGRQRVYRDLSRRPSGRLATTRRSNLGSARTSFEKSSSPKTPSPLSSTQVPPRAPTPPQAPRYPSYLPTLPSDPMTRPDGTAVYGLPPATLDFPRAAFNEKRPTSARRSSFSSTSAKVEETTEPSPPSGRIHINITKTRQSKSRNNSPSTIASPGLSQLPRLGSVRNSRHDSAAELPFEHYQSPKHRRLSSNESYSSRASAREFTRPQPTPIPTPRPIIRPTPNPTMHESEGHRQARLERERYEDREARRAASASIQAGVRAAAQGREGRCATTTGSDEEARRHEHRARAAAALEGGPAPVAACSRQEEDYEARLEAERADVARERLAFESRRRGCYQDHGAPEVARMPPERVGESGAFRGRGEAVSARGAGGAVGVTLHQTPREQRGFANALRERGEAVLAREQAKAARAERRFRDERKGEAWFEGFEGGEGWVREWGGGDVYRESERVIRAIERERERKRDRTKWV